MKLGILEKINSSHNNLRTTSMKGMFSDFPNIGETFIIFGEGIVFGNRMIHTTKIAEILELGTNEDNQDFSVFKTANSTYKITLLEEVADSADYLEETFKMPDSEANMQ
jgi:hypothetical protein